MFVGSMLQSYNNAVNNVVTGLVTPPAVVTPLQPAVVTPLPPAVVTPLPPADVTPLQPAVINLANDITFGGDECMAFVVNCLNGSDQFIIEKIKFSNKRLKKGNHNFSALSSEQNKQIADFVLKSKTRIEIFKNDNFLDESKIFENTTNENKLFKCIDTQLDTFRFMSLKLTELPSTEHFSVSEIRDTCYYSCSSITTMNILILILIIIMIYYILRMNKIYMY
jgi:hypothetical protein